MSDIQSAYWVGRRADVSGGGVSPHIYEEVDSVDLDHARFENAWNQVIHRHEMLRSTVSDEGRLRIHDKVPHYRIVNDDLRGLTRDEQETRLRVLRERHREEVLPSDTWPLWRVRTARLTDRRFRIFLSFDAIPCDARSRSVMYADWKRFYQDPSSELEALTAGFGDFLDAAAKHRLTDEYRASKEFWTQEIEGLPDPPVLPVRPSIEAATPRFKRLETTMTSDRWRICLDRCEAWGVKPTALLTAIFGRVLADWAKDPRFHIILTIFDRLGRDQTYENVIGDFTSTLVLPIDCSDDPSMKALAGRVGEDLKRLLPRSDYSGIRVMRDFGNSGRRIPRNAVTCVLTSTIGSSIISREEWRTQWMGERLELHTQTPQVGIDFQIFQVGGRLLYNWDYCTKIVPTSLAEEMFRDFEERLETFATTDDASIPTERDPVVQAAAEARGDQTEPGFLYDDIAHQAQQRPDSPAIITDDRTMSYREMCERAMWIGKRLTELGVERDDLVAIVMDKGWEQVIAALGIQMSGAAYLPIDATTPNPRIHHLLDRGRVAHVLTTSEVVDALDIPEHLNLIQVDRGGALQVPMEPLNASVSPDDLAYVIFTSGSTGEPKGVAMTHAATRNTIDDVNDRLDVRSSDRILALSSLSFDLSVYDIFGPLSRGGAVVIPSPQRAKDPSDWARLLKRHGVTLWNSVPTLAQLLFEQFQSHPETVAGCTLRTIMMSGDWIPVTLPDQLRGVLPGAEIISLGGATEAAIWSVIHHVGEIDPGWRSIPYGRSMRHQTMEVRDTNLQPVSGDAIGEIMISGTGLARGYWKDEAQTDASFVIDSEGCRHYKTGDLGRYDTDGRIEFLGRMDHQVKIRGFRIEIGEVEHAILSHPAVSNCIVKAVGPPCGERRLVAYVITAPDHGEEDLESLRAHVASMLPEYMVPARWLRMKTLPLGAHGKIDRSTDLDALISEWSITPAGGDEEDRSTISRKDPTKSLPPEASPTAIAKIRDLAEEILRIPDIHEDSDLIDLGADSVDVIRLANRIELAFDGVRPQLDDIYDAPTPAGIALLLTAHPYSPPSDPPPVAVDDPKPPAFQILKDPAERMRFRSAGKGRRPDAGDLERIGLPRNSDAERTLETDDRRRTHRCFDQNPVSLDRLGHVLECLANTGKDRLRFRYGSAGGLYPVQAYLMAMPGRVEDLAPGAYYIDPYDHCLRRIGGLGTYGPDLYDRFVNAPIVRSCAFAIMLALHADAIEPMYGDRAREYALIEAGLMAQLLETEGPNADIGFCQIGNMNYEPVHQILDLQPRDHLIYSLLGGGIPSVEVPRFFTWEEGLL